MRVFDIISSVRKAKNTQRARTLATLLKGKARLNNPKEADIPTGWNAGPHHGHHGGINWR